MLEVLDETSRHLVAIRISGKHLHDESHKLAGLIDARIAAQGHTNCFIEIHDTEGVELSALREGLEFDLHHSHTIERCAIVGDQEWERWLVRLLALFFREADVRFFPLSERDAALTWARGE